MALMLLLGTSSAWGWSYKTAADSWSCKGNTGWSNETLYTTPTGNTTQSLSVVMLTNPGSGFNILREDNCNEWNGSNHNHCLYVGLTGTASSSSSTIVRATAYWYSNGLYSKYTVVIPEGKIYIKPTGGSAISMTKNTYTYTAELTLSDAKTFDLYANDPSATIQNQWDMPSAGKPTSVRLNYTGLTSPYKYVRVSYNLKTNRITFTEMDPPCTPPDAPTFDEIPAQCGSYTLPTKDKNQVSVNWYNANGNKITSITQSGTYYAEAVDGTCVSENRTDVEITIKTKPTISISGNNSAVLYEDVTLTANATQGASVKWYEDGNEKGTGNTYVVTSASDASKTVTAKAFLNGCESEEASHTVAFSAEDCAEIPSNDIQITFVHPTDKATKCQYWGAGTLTYYIGSTKKTHSFGTSTTAGKEHTLTISNLTVDKITGVRLDAAYDYGQCTAYATMVDLEKGNSYRLTISDASQSSGNAQKTITLQKTSLTQSKPITLPAAKTTLLETTEGEGNIDFNGQVVKTGCAETLTYGFAYSTDANADKNSWTKVESTNNGNTVGSTFSGSVNELQDGTYYVCAYITNSAGTDYGAVNEITVSNIKHPIENISLDYCNRGGEIIPDPNPMCKGTTAYIKLNYVGSRYSEYKWLINGVATDRIQNFNNNVWVFNIQGDETVTVELRNDANKDGETPTWATSNKLTFTMVTEPTTPTVSLSPNVICSNNVDGATLSIASVAVGQTYVLYKYADENDNTGAEVDGYDALTCIDAKDELSFTNLTQAGRYFVKTYNTDNCRTIMSASSFATLEVVDASDVFIGFEPTSATTTPWMPAKFTVNASDKYTLTVPDGVVYNIDGNKVSVKIPLPEGTQHVTGQYQNVTFPQDAVTGYTITANLATSGGVDNPCAAPASATITLTPYVEPCTEGH